MASLLLKSMSILVPGVGSHSKPVSREHLEVVEVARLSQEETDPVSVPTPNSSMVCRLQRSGIIVHLHSSSQAR